MYKKTIKKLLHLFLCFSMLFQSFAPAYVYAEDISPTPTPEVTTTPTPEVTPSPEPTVTPTPEVTPTSTPEITVTPTTTPELTPTATVTPTPTETLTPAPEDTPTPEVTPDSTDSALPVDPTIIPTPVPTPTVIAQAVQDQNVSDQNSVTFTNVIVNTSYKYKDTNVSVTFTKLPVNAGSLSIKEIKLTPEQIAQTGAVSDTAYDITSSMENGTFEYDLTLPIPSDSQNKELTVKSTESESTINTASVVTEKKEIKSDIVTIKGLNHFTLFVVSKVVDPTVIYVNNLQPNWDNNVYAAYYYPDSDTGTPVSPGNTQVYDGRESAIIKAGITPKSGSSYKDEGLLAFKVPNVDVSSFASHVLSFDVENETGSNPVWVRIRLTDANQTEYQFVPETNPSGWHTVNAATGQWQKMNNNGDATGTKKTLSEVASDNPGLSVDRVYLTLGIGNSYNGTGSGTIGWVDKVTIDNLTYDFVIKDTCVGASVTPPSGTTACYSTIKEALDAAVDGDTINISEGTYNLTSQLNINKPVSIVGLGTVVLKSSTNYGSANGSKHLLTVYSGTQSNPVNITNITFDANGNSYGVNTYGNAYVNLDNVNILNSRGGGITVNGSTVNANELNTSGNSWYGVNVDPGSGVTTPSIFTIDSGELSEKYQIYSDGSHVTDSATVSVTATGYQKYSLGGTINIWTNRPLENVATITRGSVTTIYSTIKLAIDAAIPGDTIMVSKGTFEESPTVDLSDIKIIGVGSDINKDHTTLKGTFYFQSGEDNITITGFYQTPVWDSLNGHNLIQSGISISNSANSTISNNSFNYNPSSAFDLLGALTGTKIQFNDISIDSMDYYGNDKLFVSAAADGAFSLPFNYWGSGNSPDLSKVSSVNSVSLNRWLVAPKDTGIPNESGYHYTSNDGNIHITGGSGSTAKLYVGQYDPDSSDVETPSLPSTLIALSPYYDIVSDNDSNDGISFPLNVEINYTHQEGINTKGIYYYDTETSSWLAYSEPTISDLSISVLAPHLTKMVVAGEAEPTDVKAPLVSITNPTASMLKGSIDIRGSVVDDNPDHYYLVVNNSASKTIAGPGTVIQTDSFTDQSLFNWDTTKFSDGVYTIRLEARDKFGNKDTGSVSVKQVIVDNSGPETPTNLTPSNGVWRHTSNSNKTTWSPVTDANGPVTYYYESSVSNNVNADGSFVNKAYSSTALSVPEIYNPGEPEVTYYWHVKACDSVGNCSPWSDAWTINIDNGKPAVSVSNPTTGSYLKNPVSISGSVSDARSGVASVSYHIYKVNPDGSTTLQNGCTSLTSVINGNNWNSAVINNGGSCNLLDGNYEIAAWAYDNAGNPGWASRVRFFLDNTAPASPLITYPATNDLYFKTSPILNQWSIVTDISGIDHYRIEYKYDDGHTFSGFPYRIETNNWRNHVPALNEQGGVSFRVQAFDKAGNEGSWSDWRHYTYDATPPTSPGVPATSSYITSLTTQDWSWTSSSDSISGINQYLYRVLNLGTNTQSDWSSTGLVLGTSTNLNEGQWQLDVKSQDNAGNESTVVSSQTLIVDTTPPTTSANNSSSSWKKNSFKITLSVGDTGNSNIKTSKYNWDSAADSVTGTSFANQQQINPLQGVHTLYLYAEDNAGNTTTWSGVYKYDSQKPSVPTISTPLNNGYINSSSIQTIGWTQATDPTPGSNISTANGYHYQISTKLNFSTTERDYSVGSLSWTLTNPLADGVYYLRVQSKDNAGNYSNWSNVVGFIVDTQAPSLQSQTHFEGWYNQNQTSTFEYSDTNGAISGTPVSCVISTEGENQTCSVTPNVCDAAGNCNTQTVTSNGANIDKTLPTSAIITPSNQGSDSTIFTNSWTGNILGTATDSLSGLSKVQITIQNSQEQYWNGGGWQANQYLLNTQATDESFDTWQYTGLQNPTPDSYTIVSHATDNAGNFENSYKLTVVLDKTIPQVSLSIDPATPDAQNDWYKTQPTVTLSATDTNFDRIEYQWDNQNGSWTTYVNPFTPDSQGAHTLYYRALDKAGNVSDIGIKNISWDNTDLKDGPLNMWVSPNPTSGDTALVKWEAASDNVGIAKYEIRWSLVGSSTSYTDTVGQEIREHTINNLTEGKWNVNVKAIDAAGNWKDSNADLIVDRTSPNAPTLSLAGQGNGSATLSWTKVDDAVDYIIWYGNQPGQHLFGARVGNTTNFTVQGLGAGNYYFSVKSVDQAQNQSSFSNEVNTGNIAGAPGVNPGTPAQGFTPEVKGASTEATPSGTVITVTPSTTPQVLGMDSNRNIKDYWWLLLLIPFTLLWRLLSKKLKSMP